MCYRYTNPLYAEHLYYNQLCRKVKKNFEEFEKSLEEGVTGLEALNIIWKLLVNGETGGLEYNKGATSF